MSDGFQGWMCAACGAAGTGPHLPEQHMEHLRKWRSDPELFAAERAKVAKLREALAQVAIWLDGLEAGAPGLDRFVNRSIRDARELARAALEETK